MSVNAEQVFSLVPYARTLGVAFLEIEADQVVVELQLDESLSTVGGGMHGGALMALADIAAAVLASATADGALPATLESSTYFLNRVTGTATATATLLRRPGQCGHRSQHPRQRRQPRRSRHSAGRSH